MAAQNKQLINLLPKEEFASSTLGRFISWVLTTFRVIVIITEVVVMAAFGSRFYLDARMSDLNRQIKEDQSVIESLSSFEKEFRSAQERIDLATSLLASKKTISQNLNIISSLTPAEVFLSSISFGEQSTNIRAITASEFSISQLVANLKANDRFKNAELEQISSGDNAGEYSFSVNINSN